MRLSVHQSDAVEIEAQQGNKPTVLQWQMIQVGMSTSSVLLLHAMSGMLLHRSKVAMHGALKRSYVVLADIQQEQDSSQTCHAGIRYTGIYNIVAHTRARSICGADKVYRCNCKGNNWSKNMQNTQNSSTDSENPEANSLLQAAPVSSSL